MESKENLQTKDKIQKVKEKMIPFVTNKWTIEVLKQVVFWFYVYVMAKCFEYTTIRIDDHTIKIVWYIAIFVTGLLIDLALIITRTKLGNEMHKKFFLLALTFGILYMVICPFGTGTDEVSHFLRTYEISSKYTTLHYEDTTEFPRAFLKLSDYRSSYDTGYKEYYYGYSGFYMQGDEING